MRPLTLLIVLFPLLSVPLAAQVRGKESLPRRENSFEVIQNFPVAKPLFPFVPENLALLREPGHPAQGMAASLAKAVQRFESIRHRSPKDDLELAWAITDWVAATLLHPSFYPSYEAEEKTYPPVPDVFLKRDPPAQEILAHILKFDPKDTKHWPSPYCHHQNMVAGALMNLAGLHAQRVTVQGHTGLQFFSWSYGKWIWCEATFNEHYLLVTPNQAPIPLGVMDLHNLTLSRRLDSVRVVKHGYPDQTYLNLLPEGFRRYIKYNTPSFFSFDSLAPEVPELVMVALDAPLQSGRDRWTPSAVEEFFPQAFLDAPVTHDPLIAHQKLDAIGLVGAITRVGGGVRFTLRTLLPYTSTFEIAHGRSGAWIPFKIIERPGYMPVEALDIQLGWGAGTVRFRAVDTVGNHSQEFIIRMAE
jgi:hypothetical protein